jgi:membrane protein required for beta-lactamase induction
MSLDYSEKKSTEEKFQKIVAIIILILGIISLLWFGFHLLIAYLDNLDYDFLSITSMSRILIGLFFIGTGYVMYKFVDFGKGIAKPSR